MEMEKIITAALQLEKAETDQFGGLELYEIARKKGTDLADRLGADVNIVTLGTIFMDLKLGECLRENKLSEHVVRSSAAAKVFLRQFGLSEEIFNKIISCVDLHHGAPHYPCLEAEICANADGYKFLTPRGIFIYFGILGGRENDIISALGQVEAKMEEKYRVLSLDICKKELEGYYQEFKDLIALAKG